MPVEIPLPGGQPARVHRGGARGVREQDTVACRASVRGEASHGPGVLLNPPPYVQVANRTIYTRDNKSRDSGRDAVSPRPLNSFSRIVARTEGYTFDATVWALCLVQGPDSVALALIVRFATSTSLWWFGAREAVAVLTRPLTAGESAARELQPAGRVGRPHRLHLHSNSRESPGRRERAA
jgi:hypothetical protein